MTKNQLLWKMPLSKLLITVFIEAPKLGDRVNMGAGAKILGNVTLEDEVNICFNYPSGATC